VSRLTILLLVLLYLTPAPAAAFCFEEAGREAGVEPALLWAIAQVESGFNPAAVSTNTNGSLDVGLMQINSSWRNQLGEGIWNDLFDPCTNVRVASGILADCIAEHGYSWQGIGCYNAVSSDKQAVYARKILSVMQQILARQQRAKP
jgi:soluble lytic murein transglycosylase-like protein